MCYLSQVSVIHTTAALEFVIDTRGSSILGASDTTLDNIRVGMNGNELLAVSESYVNQITFVCSHACVP